MTGTSPHDAGGSPDELAQFERQAEVAYDRMYDATNATAAAACYSDAKDALSAAIGIARRTGDGDAVTRLEARLAHIKAVFRSQFT